MSAMRTIVALSFAANAFHPASAAAAGHGMNILPSGAAIGGNTEELVQILQSVISEKGGGSARRRSSFLREAEDQSDRNLELDDSLLDLLGMCAGGEFVLDYGDGNVCRCSLSSTDGGSVRRFRDTVDISRDADFILENGLDVEFGCSAPMTCDASRLSRTECTENELTCKMSFDVGKLEKTSTEYRTCAEYGNSPWENRPTTMTGRTLCMEVDLESDASFCEAKLDSQDCECRVCGNDLKQGVALTCGDFETNQCERGGEGSGLEFVDFGDISSLISANTFAPQFMKVENRVPDTGTPNASLNPDADDISGESEDKISASSTTSAGEEGPVATMPFLISALAAIFLSTKL